MTHHSPRRQTRSSIVLVAVGMLCATLIMTLLLSLGMQNLRGEYRYDGGALSETEFPFETATESEFLTVNMRFSLNPIHASRFLVGPDDCIASVTINGTDIPEAKDLCNMRPGHRITLQNLQQNNTLQIRIRDTGGTGGLSVRTSWLDPIALTLLLLLLLCAAWTLRQISLLLGSSSVAAWLPFIMALAFALRLGLAWHGGFGGDISINRNWARDVVLLGPAAAYSERINPEVMLPNYPPLSMLVLGVTGAAYQATVSPEFDVELPLYHIIIKLPAILADLLTILAVYLILLPMAGRFGAFLGATVYAVHPAVIHNSAIWGQTDALFTLMLLCTLLCIQRERWALGAMAYAAALLLKMQAIVLLPVVCAALLPSPRRWLIAALGGTFVAVLVLLPFAHGGALDNVYNVYANSVGYYANLSSNAYNLWVMLFSRDTDRTATDLLLPFLTYRTLGLILWSGVILTVINTWFRALHGDIRLRGKTGMLCLSSAMIAYAFFLFNAEMHERYLFPTMALGLPLIFTGTRGMLLYLAASALFTLNLISIVAFGDWDHWLFQEQIGKSLPVIVATLQVVVFFWTWKHIHAYQSSLKQHGSLWAIVWPRCRKWLRTVRI